MQGLIAIGRDVATVRRAGSRSPVGYLQSLIGPDGSVRYSRTGTQTPVWVTAQALTALAGKTFPIAPARRRATRSAHAASGVSPTAHARPRGRARRTNTPAAAPAEPQATHGLEPLARAMGALIGTVLAPVMR